MRGEVVFEERGDVAVCGTRIVCDELLKENIQATILIEFATVTVLCLLLALLLGR